MSYYLPKKSTRKPSSPSSRRVDASARGRLLRLLAVAIAGGAAGWATAAFGAGVLGIAATVAAAIVAVGLWNTMPILFRPSPRYASLEPSRLRWPEAAPIEPAGRHRRLLFCVPGFPSTPADFRKVAEASDARGWDLAAPLLPGCGTDPGDLLPTEWSQYLAAIRDEWTRLRGRYDAACLVGTSMGGSLALALAEETCGIPASAPAAIATIGSPVVLNAWLRHGIVSNPLVYLSRLLGPLVPSVGAGFPDPERKGEDGDGDWKGYRGTYTKQAFSIQLGLRAMERRLDEVTCPALVCHARGDRMVAFRNAGLLLDRLGSKDIEAYVANMDGFGHMRHNLILYDSQREPTWDRILDFFEKRTY